VTRITGTVQEDVCTFMALSYSVLFRRRNVSHKICCVNQNTHFMFNNLFFFFENRAFYEIMWKEYCRAAQATVDNIAHALFMLDS
jgi:hypothetical protein